MIGLPCLSQLEALETVFEMREEHTDLKRPLHDCRHIIPFISPRAFIKPTTVNPHPHWELGVLIDRGTPDDIQRKTGF